MAAAVAGETHDRARRVMEQADALNLHTEDEIGLTRRYGTPALRSTQDLVDSWMQGAGLTTRRDAVGNLIGRYEGATPGAPSFILGSHLDSVRNGGKYDGPLGVLVALTAIEHLHDSAVRLPFAIELTAFADEEGTRFHTDYLGSRAYLGSLDRAHLDRLDNNGITLRQAIADFGGDPEAVGNVRACPEDAIGYVEVHIEQGPTLEAAGLPVGVVSAIVGQVKFMIEVRGVAGHAGTVAMSRRHDALAGAAELILAAEAIARDTPELVATVGEVYVKPGASNVIPAQVRLTLDLRHPDDAVRAKVVPVLRAQVEELHRSRGVTSAWEIVMENPAKPSDSELSGLLATAIEQIGFPATRLASGAGHDGVAFSTEMPFAMLFVRCEGGISHNPAESVKTDDVAVAIGVLDRFLRLRAAAMTG